MFLVGGLQGSPHAKSSINSVQLFFGNSIWLENVPTSVNYIETLVEDLKAHISNEEGEGLNIDINNMSDYELEDDQSAFSSSHVSSNLSESFEWLETGSTRHVYRIKTPRYGPQYEGKVIKFAKTPRRRKYNSREIEAWMAVKSREIGSYFSPIRMFDPNNSWLIMDYANPNLSPTDAREIQEKIESRIEDKRTFDIHYNNIGMHPDRGKVLIDYSWGGDFAFTG